MRIILCDDEVARLDAWKSQLDAMDVPLEREVSTIADVDSLIQLLEDRRRVARESDSPESFGEPIDAADILILDFDLGTNKLAITGRRLAYLARCYSDCGFIILMNENGENSFDLAMKWDLESFADLSIGSKQLANPGLWGGRAEGYRPWHWPNVPAAAAALRDNSADILVNMDKPALLHIGLNESEINSLPRTIIEQLWGESENSPKSINDVTFRDLASSNGPFIQGKDVVRDKQLPQVVASRVMRWLEECVLAGQDILVDAPHLASRFPSLIVGDVNDLQEWNRVSVMPPEEPHCHLSEDALREVRFPGEKWMSRPVWRWKETQRNDAIAEVKDPFGAMDIDFVFCEDISEFSASNDARPYVADLPSPFVRRWISKRNENESSKNKVNFKPLNRLTQ